VASWYLMLRLWIPLHLILNPVEAPKVDSVDNSSHASRLAPVADWDLEVSWASLFWLLRTALPSPTRKGTVLDSCTVKLDLDDVQRTNALV
jgi:hypothetical protein